MLCASCVWFQFLYFVARFGPLELTISKVRGAGREPV